MVKSVPLAEEEERDFQGKAMWGHSEKEAIWNPGRGPDHPDLRLPPSRTVRNTFLLFKPPSLGYVVIAGQADYDSWFRLKSCLFYFMHLKTSQEGIRRLHYASRGFQGATKFKNPSHGIFWVITRTWTFFPVGRGGHWWGEWMCYLSWHMFKDQSDFIVESIFWAKARIPISKLLR